MKSDECTLNVRTLFKNNPMTGVDGNLAALLLMLESDEWLLLLLLWLLVIMLLLYLSRIGPRNLLLELNITRIELLENFSNHCH